MSNCSESDCLITAFVSLEKKKWPGQAFLGLVSFFMLLPCKSTALPLAMKLLVSLCMSLITVFLICAFPSVKINIFFPHIPLAVDIWEFLIYILKDVKSNTQQGSKHSIHTLKSVFSLHRLAGLHQRISAAPPNACLSKLIPIPFQHAIMKCTTNPTHFVYRDVLNVCIDVSVVIWSHAFTWKFWISIVNNLTDWEI